MDHHAREVAAWEQAEDTKLQVALSLPHSSLVVEPWQQEVGQQAEVF